MTTVDILLPHYGRMDLLQEAVASVLAQSDPGWRLTIVDDNGDRAEEALAAWCAALDDPRVVYLRNERNLGINRNFQRCVTLVENELAVIIGSDDLMLPGYVRCVREAYARRPDVAIVQPGVEVIDEHGQPSRGMVDLAKRWVYAPRVSEQVVLRGEELALSLVRGNWLYFPSLCWRADALKRTGFREGFSVVQDLALVLDLVLDGESLLVDPTTCFHYRRHSGSVSSAHAADGRRFAEERRFFVETAARLDDRGWPRAARAARRHTSSRINALTRMPGALRNRDGASVLVRHIVGR
ncbi:hypothetical protein GCM10009836_61880 [Pseudonocardia ailaonensis]|uniref:Glycosyltransferase 2-like domain-containing protein n=1 Tax=Pseudonocardia ailaonensis TaxID=367279 RepID=A0ABN2NLK1_9PSEU